MTGEVSVPLHELLMEIGLPQPISKIYYGRVSAGGVVKALNRPAPRARSW